VLNGTWVGSDEDDVAAPAVPVPVLVTPSVVR